MELITSKTAGQRPTAPAARTEAVVVLVRPAVVTVSPPGWHSAAPAAWLSAIADWTKWGNIWWQLGILTWNTPVESLTHPNYKQIDVWAIIAVLHLMCRFLLAFFLPVKVLDAKIYLKQLWLRSRILNKSLPQASSTWQKNYIDDTYTLEHTRTIILHYTMNKLSTVDGSVTLRKSANRMQRPKIKQPTPLLGMITYGTLPSWNFWVDDFLAPVWRTVDKFQKERCHVQLIHFPCKRFHPWPPLVRQCGPHNVWWKGSGPKELWMSAETQK